MERIVPRSPVTQSSEKIRVLFCEDHPIAREGLVAIITAQSDMLLVGQAASGEEAISLFKKEKPDVTLMDLRLPGGMDGVTAIQAIRIFAPAARFLVLTTYSGDEDIHRALAAGAQGYLLKSVTIRQELLAAIRTLHAGCRYIPPAIGAALSEFVPRVELTPRELEVLKLIAAGNKNKQIAHSLGISESTVKDHVSTIIGKLGANDRTEAVIIALRRGILTL